MEKLTQEFIEKHIDLIDENKWDIFVDELFDAADVSSNISDVYRMLEEANIDIIEYLNFIPDYYLYNNYDRKELYISEYARRIGASAYENNSLLETIHIPKTVHTFHYRCFADCPNLKDIYIDRPYDELTDLNINYYWLQNSGNPKIHFTDRTLTWGVDL